MKITRILCPTDFSQTSAHAVDQAIALAGYYKAGITALHVVTPVEPALDAMPLDALRQETARFFGAAAETNVAVEVLVEVGSPIRHILDCASRMSASLIVMGTHGTGGFEHLVLGSVAERVLRKAPCPVLTVPPRVRTDVHLPFTRILCAVDLSVAQPAEVPFAASLAGESGAHLTLLHVLEWPWHEPPAPDIDALAPEQGFALAAFRRDAEERARKRLASLVPTQPFVTREIRSGKPYEQILDVAAKEHTDLIVVGVGGRGLIDMALLGSTANHVVRSATCPVLTLRRTVSGSPPQGQGSQS